jgi:hypothetical protein
MPLTLFLAFSILGLDFLLYALFQWTYGERDRKRVRRRGRNQQTFGHHDVGRPCLGHESIGRQTIVRHAVGPHSVQTISRIR